SYEAIAKTLGVSRSAAETLTSRARRRLADLYEHATHADTGCTWTLERLADLADGALSRRELDQHRRHARRCDHCAGWLRLIDTANDQRGGAAPVAPILAGRGESSPTAPAW